MFQVKNARVHLTTQRARRGVFLRRRWLALLAAGTCSIATAGFAGDVQWQNCEPTSPLRFYEEPCPPGSPSPVPGVLSPPHQQSLPRPSAQPDAGPANRSQPNQFDAPIRSENLDPDAGALNEAAAAGGQGTQGNQNTAPSSNDFGNINAADFQSSFASTQSSFSSAPTLIGDFAGGGFAQFNTTIVESFDGYAIGTAGPNPVFDLSPGGGFYPDLISTGAGIDGSGDGNIDTFDLAEPIPPTDAGLPSGPGFAYQGGSIVYTGPGNTTDTTAQNGVYASGDNWYFQYDYAQTLGGGGNGRAFLPVPSPGVSVRRVKISENFSPEVRDRFFLNYSFFNDAFGGLGDISRYIMGSEFVVVPGLASVEIRLPVAATYASRQDRFASEARDLEVGNLSVIGKTVLLRRENFLWSGGLGIGAPTADDTKITSRQIDLIQIRNQTTMIQPFTGAIVRRGDWAFQAYGQLDIAAGGDAVMVNTNLNDPQTGKLAKVGEFLDSTLMHLDFSAHRTLYQNQRSDWLSSVIGNAELHYTKTLEDSDIVSGNNFTYTNLKPNFDIVNATFGTHLVMGRGRNVIVTPAMSIPLRDGLDEQFDYEAIVQVNYIR